MNYMSIKIIIIFIIILLVGCSEDPPNENDDINDDINNDTIPITMPQEHIPWPSLADSPWPMYMRPPTHGQKPLRRTI
ncbi:MAG: hypothetical protein IIB95_13055 [Candidatus Marinimicrobia bacterium]|nr:hypothetical protein [Candidatus Neomarinimicrobiota bacterium]